MGYLPKNKQVVLVLAKVFKGDKVLLQTVGECDTHDEAVRLAEGIVVNDLTVGDPDYYLIKATHVYETWDKDEY